MKPYCFNCPTRRSLYETSLYPIKAGKEPHSLTSSTTSRACSAPFHKMISKWLFPNDESSIWNHIALCALRDVVSTRLRLYPHKAGKEPHSLTSSTTSRACSAPFHKMISIKWFPNDFHKNDFHQMDSSYRVGVVQDQFWKNWSRTANSITTCMCN